MGECERKGAKDRKGKRDLREEMLLLPHAFLTTAPSLLKLSTKLT